MDTHVTYGYTGDYFGQVIHEIKLTIDLNYKPY